MPPRKRIPVDSPIYINPASVEIGDLIRVAWNAGGIAHTRTARVHRRIDHGDVRAFFTAEGTEIMHWLPEADKKVRITLLEKAQPVETMATLFDLLENEA